MKHSSKYVMGISEQLGEGVRMDIEGTRPALESRSAFQEIAVEQTKAFGGLYRLDGKAMAAEADEFIIHESLAHGVAMDHPDPHRALVLGGGDGASARELLKHAGIESIVVAELDEEVVKRVRAELPALPDGAFESPRVDLRIGEAAATLAAAHARGERFDLILFDLTEPDDPACRHLHEARFLHLCAASLNRGGRIHVQLGSPFYQGSKVAALYRRLATVFPVILPSLISVPLYGGPWLLAAATVDNGPAPSLTVLEQRLARRNIAPLRYYNPALHLAGRVLPNYVRALLA